VAATNRPDILDPALLRPGRFDRQVIVEAPDVKGRLQILQLHARGRRFAPDADLRVVARATAGFTGADLANVLNEAALLAVRRQGHAIEPDDLAEAIERVVDGPRRTGTLLTSEERRRLAYHEAGHAVVAGAEEFPGHVRRVSIVSRGKGAGHTEFARTDRNLLTRDELRSQLALVMAGTVAEEVVFGQPSTAGEGDLERATELARALAGRYGMTPQVGQVRVLPAEGEVFLGRDYLSGANVSADTMARVEDAMRDLIEQAAKRARVVLEERRPLLDKLADQLVAEETVTEEELQSLLKLAARPRRTRAREPR